MTPNKQKPMRTRILEAIQAGGATKESLIEMAETTPKGLSSQFTYLRMMGFCPMLQEDKTYKIVTAEEWETHRAEVAANSKTKTLSPEKRAEKAQKRYDRGVTGLENATKRAEGNPDNVLYGLQKQKAEIELKIADLELASANEMLAASSGASSEQESASASNDTGNTEQAPVEQGAFA